MTPNRIPMVRAAFMKQFEIAMLKNGISPEPYFKQVGLPVDPDINPDSLLPETPFWKLINLVAEKEKTPDFGVRVAQALPWHKISSLKPLIETSHNLQDLLDTFCTVVSDQSNTSKFLLERCESGVFFISDTHTLFKNDRQMEQYRATSMIQFVQLATGSAWIPESIDLQMNRFEPFLLSHAYRGTQLRFSQPHTRIPIPKIALELPVNLEIKYTINGSSNYDIHADFTNTLKQLIEIYVVNGKCRIQVVADVAGMSVRQMQRKLKDEGTSFNQILAEVRYKLALLKLQDSTLNVSKIAYELGYTDPAHFTRAFRRWAGMSPRSYRKTMQ